MNALEEYRKKLGISRREIAVRSGLTEQTIINVERGKSCSLRTAKKIAEATNFAVNLSDLIPDKQEGSK